MNMRLIFGWCSDVPFNSSLSCPGSESTALLTSKVEAPHICWTEPSWGALCFFCGGRTVNELSGCMFPHPGAKPWLYSRIFKVGSPHCPRHYISVEVNRHGLRSSALDNDPPPWTWLSYPTSPHSCQKVLAALLDLFFWVCSLWTVMKGGAGTWDLKSLNEGRQATLLSSLF